MKALLVLGIALIPAQTLCARAETADGYAEFAAFLEHFREKESIRALTALIVHDGEIVWEQAFGTSDDERDITATMDTTFGIKSVTKPIAATAILAEVDAGRIDLDLPLHADPDWDDFCEWLSGSGIPFGSGGTDNDGTVIAPVDCGRDLKLRDVLDMRVNGAGDTFVYNPVTYARIDRAIEGAGGRPLRDIVRENIFDIAGISDAALGWHDPKGGSALRRLAPPFTIDTDGRDRKAAFADDDFRAAAGIWASARHIAAFDIAFEAGQLIAEKWRRQILASKDLPERGDYRFGWFVQDWRGQRLQWHSGWEPDRYSAIYLKVPARKISLILLANNERLWWHNPLSKAAIETSPVAAKFLELFAN